MESQAEARASIQAYLGIESKRIERAVLGELDEARKSEKPGPDLMLQLFGAEAGYKNSSLKRIKTMSRSPRPRANLRLHFQRSRRGEAEG